MFMKNTDFLKLFKSKSTVLTLKEISLIWQDTNINNTKSRVNYFVQSGKLFSPRKGIYVKSNDYDRFELATKLYSPSYISLETVLQREGIIFQYYENIFIISYLSREISCNKERYVYKKIKNQVLLNPLGIENKENYFIATKERAFLDAIYLYKDYYFDNLNKINWELCYQIASIYKNKKLVKKLEMYRKHAEH